MKPGRLVNRLYMLAFILRHSGLENPAHGRMFPENPVQK